MPNSDPSINCSRTIIDDVRRALAEDVGSGDINRHAEFPPNDWATAHHSTPEAATLCGYCLGRRGIRQVAPDDQVSVAVQGGEELQPRPDILPAGGPARGC